MKMKLIIEISGLDHIPQEQIDESPHDSELEYYVSLLYADPPLLLDGANYELIELED